MIALYASKYTTQDLKALSAALETALTHFCGGSWDCSECEYKRPCRDLNRLNKHVNDKITQQGGNR